MAHPIFSETFSDWIAIGSLAGSISIVVLAKFNYWCARTAKRQAKAATEQACVALIAAERARDQADRARQDAERVLASLKSLESQQKSLDDRNRQNAVDQLLAIAQNCRLWIPLLPLPLDGTSLSLARPDLTETLLSAAHGNKPLAEEFRLFEARLAAAQNTLRAFMEQPTVARQTAQKIMATLGNHLEQVANTAENFAFRIETGGMPREWSVQAEEPLPKPRAKKSSVRNIAA